ncbi:MAG: glycoside hydrolase family 16 protein [Bacteroidales bacterium]|nr:glycoside hydrolase family 16 protein [Bacteroidales bacterium]
MKKVMFAILYLVCAVAMYAQDPAFDSNWEVVFQDGFTDFDSALWYKKEGQSHGTDEDEEPQIYKSSNAYIEDGKLVLKTTRLNHGVICQLGNACHYNVHKHTIASGEIMSNTTYKYGYYEMYAKIPNGQGYWPAFWLWNAGNCWYNEIDIFEGKGCLSNEVTNNLHWCFDCPITNSSYINDTIDYAQAFNYSYNYHWYGVEWNEDEIIWYIDRQKVKSIANYMDGIGIQHPMYIIINLALYPQTSDCATDTSNVVLQKCMYVDQVNVYKLKCDKNTVVNDIPCYSSFDYAVKKSITLSNVSSLTIGQDIYLKATDFIELHSGFEVPIGAQLSLQTTPCE